MDEVIPFIYEYNVLYFFFPRTVNKKLNLAANQISAANSGTHVSEAEVTPQMHRLE